MVAVPGAMPPTKPALSTVATELLDELSSGLSRYINVGSIRKYTSGCELQREA